MIIAQLSIGPIGEGTSVSKYVRTAIKKLDEMGVCYELGAMSTTIEAKNIDELFDAVKEAHLAVINAGAKRIITDLKIDDRRDKEASIETKLKAVKL